MWCFMQPVSAMDRLHVGPGIILLLIHMSSVQETLHLHYIGTVHQPYCPTVPLHKYPGGLSNASASLQAVCQELECLLSASWGLRRQHVGWGIWVSVLPLFSTFFFFFLLLSLITSSCAGSCLRNTGNFWGFDREDSGKGYNPELGNVYLRKIWLTKFLWSSTLLYCNKLGYRFSSVFLHQI